jgi:streptomycin 6-kinase
VRAVQNWIWMLEDLEEFEADSDDPAFLTVPEIAPWAASR